MQDENEQWGESSLPIPKHTDKKFFLESERLSKERHFAINGQDSNE